VLPAPLLFRISARSTSHLPSLFAAICATVSAVSAYDADFARLGPSTGSLIRCIVGPRVMIRQVPVSTTVRVPAQGGRLRPFDLLHRLGRRRCSDRSAHSFSHERTEMNGCKQWLFASEWTAIWCASACQPCYVRGMCDLSAEVYVTRFAA
jgi:hypothetical protein